MAKTDIPVFDNQSDSEKKQCHLSDQERVGVHFFLYRSSVPSYSTKNEMAMGIGNPGSDGQGKYLYAEFPVKFPPGSSDL